VSLEYKLIFHKDATKFLQKQDKDTQKRPLNAIGYLLSDNPKGDIRLMRGESELLRLRVGTFRILFYIDMKNKVVYIEAIGNRGDIYKKT
jgi:mRNA interferase RelE/StbE